MVFGLPITGFYVLLLAVALWLVLEYLPIGRYVYAIGANPKAAALNGIPVRRFVIAAFVSSGTLAALAGVLLASKLRIGQASVGLEYLLPALVGAFLGSTTIKPGRVNVWGTMTGVIILAVGISGIQQFGGSFFVEPLFNGVTLLVAIGIAGYAQRKTGCSWQNGSRQSGICETHRKTDRRSAQQSSKGGRTMKRRTLIQSFGRRICLDARGCRHWQMPCPTPRRWSTKYATQRHHLGRTEGGTRRRRRARPSSCSPAI